MLKKLILERLEKYRDNVFLETEYEFFTYGKLLYDIQSLDSGNNKKKYAIAMINGYEIIKTILSLIIRNNPPLLLNPALPADILNKTIKKLNFEHIINKENNLKDSNIPIENYEEKDDYAAFYLLSSGTTGDPKMAARSHRSIVEQCKILVKAFHLNEKSRVLAIPPFFHSYGVEAILFNTIYAGGTLIIPEKPGFGMSMAENLDKFNLTHIFANPPLVKLLDNFKKNNSEKLNTVKTVITAGSLLDDKSAESFKNQFKFNAAPVYGLSEVGCVAVSSGNKEIKNGYAGDLFPEFEIKTTDVYGATLEQGEKGVIWIKKPYNDLGYPLQKEKTDELFQNGWFKTNDIGYFNEEKEIFLTGSRSDSLNIGGEKVDPGDIELAIMEHKEVEECVVFGIPHKIYGNIVKSIIYSKTLKEDNLREFLSDKLEPVAIPSKIEIIDIPLKRTAAGKISRFLYSNEIKKEIE